MKLTIKDIAILCKVGKSTVSRVLNNDPRVSKTTREKVQQMIDSVGFQPNRSARAMRGTQEPVVGIIVSRLNSVAESQTLSVMLKMLYQHHITPLIVESQFQSEQVSHHLKLFQQRQVEGVILFAFSELPLAVIQQWKGSLVIVARQYPHISTVYYDDYNAVQALMTKLYHLGHRKIAYLGVRDSDETTGKARNKSYTDFCQSYQLQPNMVQADLDAESGYIHTPSLFIQPVSALLCASSTLAIGALKYLQEQNQQVSLACIGQNALIEHFVPDLISLDFGYPQAGKWAVELLLKQFQGDCAIEQRKVPFHLN